MDLSLTEEERKVTLDAMQSAAKDFSSMIHGCEDEINMGFGGPKIEAELAEAKRCLAIVDTVIAKIQGELS